MGKRLKMIEEKNDYSSYFSLEEAVELAIKSSTTKFIETIDICMNLNIDPKNGEQNVRGKIKLPKSLGKNRNRLFDPSTKNPRELNFGTSGVTFRDERHGNAQKFTAPPNRHFTCFETTFETLQNLQTAKKSRGYLRFQNFVDEVDPVDPN